MNWTTSTSFTGDFYVTTSSSTRIIDNSYYGNGYYNTNYGNYSEIDALKKTIKYLIEYIEYIKIEGKESMSFDEFRKLREKGIEVETGQFEEDFEE